MSHRAHCVRSQPCTEDLDGDGPCECPCTCERRTGERRENNRRYSLWRSACFTHDLSRAGRAIQGGVACRNRTDRRTTDRRSPEGEEQSE